MHDADLRYADLRDADLSYANLSDVNLSSADLARANLSSTDLSYANLSDTNLTNTNLSNANLSNANLIGANLNRTGLEKTSFRNTRVGRTTFSNIDLRTIIELDTVRHTYPSTIGLDTLYLSRGQIPEVFLRGAGVPDDWIVFTMMHPTQYHSCFIAYSSNDGLLARRLYADLQERGVRCWFAPEDIKIGERIRHRLNEAILLQDKLLLLLSKHALASDWIEVEVEAALEKELLQSREVLFPVRLDESVMQATQAWAKQLRRSRHIGDFTHWTDPQAYEQAFKRLLRDLKAEAKGGKNG